MDNYFTRLNQINVNDHIEKKGQFSYLSWPYAVAQLRLADPTACWEVRRFDGLPYLKTEAGYFVEVAVTVQGVTLSQIHPVLDGKNRPIFEPTAFDINTSLQRCLVKAIALHGLGLYIYAGEDLPGGRQARRRTEPEAQGTDHPDHQLGRVRHRGADPLHRAPDRRDRQRSRQGARLLRRRCRYRNSRRRQRAAASSHWKRTGEPHEHHRQTRSR